MRGPGTSKHCVTNMAADEEAANAASIAAIVLVNKEEEENREIVLDVPNVLIFSPVETYLNLQRSSRRPSWLSVHTALGSRMDGMAFCPFRNRNAE